MRRLIWIGYLLMFIVPAPVFATVVGYPTDVELASLPQYCYVKLRNKFGGPEYQSWKGILGADFIHTHHFCAGLNFMNRYSKAYTAYDKQFYLKSALTEFGYMIDHAAPTYSLMPEVYLNRGTAFSKLGKINEAMSDFRKAIELNPRLPKAYTMMADFCVEKKLQDMALATITEGLRYAPNSKMLQRRYVELGGKKPFPEPYEQAAVDVQPSTEKTEKALPAQSKEDSDNMVKSAPDPMKPQSRAQQSQPGQAIGVPGNPWCRFCTDSDSKPQ